MIDRRKLTLISTGITPASKAGLNARKDEMESDIELLSSAVVGLAERLDRYLSPTRTEVADCPAEAATPSPSPSPPRPA